MGRGRAKAKQRKVARELKYRTYQSDLGALQAELSADHQPEEHDGDPYDPYAGDPYDPYDPYAPAEEADDDRDGYNGASNGSRP